MKTKIINASEFKTSFWSGGDTTEIYIYPPESDYAKKDFLFRISSATVKDKESVFTKLEGVKRFLRVIKGSIILEHTGFHTVHLAQYDGDEFLGDWETKCFGCCTDFNLMIRGENKGALTILKVDNNGQKVELEEGKVYVFYSFNTNLKLSNFNIKKNTALIISQIENVEYINLFGDGVVLVSCVDLRNNN